MRSSHLPSKMHLVGSRTFKSPLHINIKVRIEQTKKYIILMISRVIMAFSQLLVVLRTAKVFTAFTIDYAGQNNFRKNDFGKGMVCKTSFVDQRFEDVFVNPWYYRWEFDRCDEIQRPKSGWNVVRQINPQKRKKICTDKNYSCFGNTCTHFGVARTGLYVVFSLVLKTRPTNSPQSKGLSESFPLVLCC